MPPRRAQPRRARWRALANALAVSCVVCGSAIAVAAASAPAAGGGATALEGRAVWIWDLHRSAGGLPSAIAARARAAGVRSVFVKAADGANRLAQFTPSLVGDLRALGVAVCAWQYVYGRHPAAEAAAAVAVVRDGAPCLIVDAEAEYQGRYWAAQRYIDELRAGVGQRFPLALTSLPYTDLHPSFPYSVFLGRGGAQFLLPQMYWRAIGTSIDAVFAHTFVDNRIYGRTIVPVGQSFGRPSAREIVRFRALTVAYGAPGISWWDWAWASHFDLWGSMSALLSSPSHFGGPDMAWPVLARGSRGDAVLWLQEHLARWYPSQRTSGLFAGQTLAYLDAFQARHGLAVTGATDPATWRALLALAPVRVDWRAPGGTPIRHGR